VPLLHQGAVLGVLQVLNKRSGAPFTAQDQALLTAFAGQAVIALENARLLAQTDQALQQRVQELEVLQQLDRALNTTLDPARVLTLALDWLLRICAGTAGGIVLVDEEKRPLRHAAQGYTPGFERAYFAGEPISAGILGDVLHTCRPHVTGDVRADPRYVAAAPATQSQLTLPLVHQQRLIGGVALESDRPDAFDAALAARAERVTTHAAAAIANALLYEKVHAANQAKSEFVSLASHELKTPMTAVRGYAQLMLSGMAGELTERQRGFLETIVANVARMGRQIQDLTDISQIETGRLALVWAPVDFAHIVSDTLQTVQALYDEKGVRMALDLPPDLPLVMGDQGRLVQVLTNLLSNACKYSPAGTQVQITLRADMLAARPNRPGEPPIPMVVCAVQDQGYGISAEDQQRLFTKFFRAQDPNIRQSKGTGLGLSISRGIVELHHGRIWVESTLGQGTTFSFAIPQA
jgi:signal transduction histidine kinase